MSKIQWPNSADERIADKAQTARRIIGRNVSAASQIDMLIALGRNEAVAVGYNDKNNRSEASQLVMVHVDDAQSARKALALLVKVGH